MQPVRLSLSPTTYCHSQKLPRLITIGHRHLFAQFVAMKITILIRRFRIPSAAARRFTNAFNSYNNNHFNCVAKDSLILLSIQWPCEKEKNIRKIDFRSQSISHSVASQRRETKFQSEKQKNQPKFSLLFLSRNEFVILFVALCGRSSPYSCCQQMNRKPMNKKRNEFSLARRSRDSYRAFVSKNVLFSRNVNVVDGIAAAALLPPPPPPPNVARSCGAHAMAKPFKISLTPLH